MLIEVYKCERRDCGNTAPKNAVPATWLVVLWLYAYVNSDMPSVDKRELHFCCARCLVEAYSKIMSNS